jgi:competence protein ComEC
VSGEAETRKGADGEAGRPSRAFGNHAAVLFRKAGIAARTVFLASVAAELAVFPIGASVFHRITVAGLALNFVAIPLMTIAQLGGLVALLLCPISSVLARGAALVAAAAAEGLTWSTSLVDLAPWLTWRVPAPGAAALSVYYGSWVVLLMMPRSRLRIGTGALVAVASLAIAWPALTDRLLDRRSPAPGHLRVTILDVGQGDAIVVQFPGGATMLVDAAGLPRSSFDLGDRVITPAMLALGVRRLQILAITHGDPDHAEGAPSVVRDFSPGELWEGVPVPPHQTLRALRMAIAERGGAARLVQPGDQLSVGPVDLRILHPGQPDWERQRVRNDDSIVMELRYHDVSIVLPGDIGSGVEGSLIGQLSDAPIRILKAAHHGSATSSSDAWLEAARPAAVIFSCGRDNRYGHPAPIVLERVKSRGAAIFRTDQDGAITVTTDGKSATVTTFTKRVARLTRFAG